MAGGDNNVAIIVGKYAPEDGTIHCGGNIATTGGCRGFMGGIPVGLRKLLFAPEGNEADVVLPATIRSRKYETFCPSPVGAHIDGNASLSMNGR